MAATVETSDFDKAAGARKKLKDEALQRLEDARNQKSSILNDHQNCYFYTAPRRIREQSSNSSATPNPPGDDRQLQTSFGFEVVDDFMSMLIDTFMPREGWWAERALPTNPDPDGQEDPEVEDTNKKIRAEDKKVFDQIRASNFYAEIAKAGRPDAAIGVNALLVRDPGKGQPIICLGVPIRELDFDLGPDGRPDFRSVTRHTKYRHLPALLDSTIYAKLPDEQARKVRTAGNTDVDVVWAWWRNWQNEGDVEWQHVVLVAGELIHDATSFGDGSIALLVGRFGATPDFAWPDGPLVKSLPDLVQLDELRAALIENVDFTLRPPKAYEDDGVLNLPSTGVRPAEFYAKRASGGKPAFEDIYEPRPIQAALFEVDHLQQRIKRLHYIDVPEQQGKTPPTATQWVDELVIRQRRIGTPGFAYWYEFPYEVFQRFRYLAEKRGVVKKPKDLGVPDNVSLRPYNPAERAQDTQEVSTAVRFAQIGAAIAPTMWRVMVDEGKTLRNFQKKLRDELVVLRSDEEVTEKIKQLVDMGAGQLLGGDGSAGQGTPPAPTAGTA
jgi:hypothetical protein